jgi:peptidoglycan/xylan/chitin deacetylase (PgdA/CDA1 family)
MRIPGLKTGKKTALWLKNKISPGALILGYHRIAKVENDSFYNCMSPSHFAQQMEVLRNCTHPISLDELVACLNHGEPSPKTVCVTIDDGYADTLYSAKPILEKFEIPATVFVTTGNLGGEFWWDELERYVLSAPEDAGLLRLGKGKLDFEWDFNNPNPTKRASQITSIADFLRPLDAANRRLLLNKIKEWSGNTDLRALPPVRSMTANELVSLIDGGLIQIGSHTVTHPVLSELSEQERRYEIDESKRELEEILAKPVLGFSYPNGCFTKGDPKLVSQSGYQYACMSKNGAVRSNSDRFTLPRFWIPDWDGPTFERWLLRWL